MTIDLERRSEECADEGSVYFWETGYWVDPLFHDYWERNGGLAIFGFPLSERFAVSGQNIQYFERARFERHDGAWYFHSVLEEEALAEAARVLRPGGHLLSSFFNPAVFIADRDPSYAKQGLIRPTFTVPYSDLSSLDADALQAKQARMEPLIFGHSLAQKIFRLNWPKIQGAKGILKRKTSG